MSSNDGTIRVRDAEESDVDQIRDVYLATYGEDYAYPQYYDTRHLKKMAFADDTVLLVAEEIDSGRILGTASVLVDIGAFADLVGEFGRLAVHPDARRRGIGRLLMKARLERVKDRLHLGLVDNRVAHPYSQKISLANGFVPVGFLPLKLQLSRRESVVLFARHFGPSLSLRRNNPRIIPEAYTLAKLALPACGLPCDAIVDDEAQAYPHNDDFDLDELSTEGYAALLRFQRGRVQHREIFGPLRLHYGLFKLKVTHSNYLLAKQDGQVVGAVGFTVDEVERVVRVFELISVSEQPTHFLLDQLVNKCRDQWDVHYIEADVSAYEPRMQRTLLALNFLPSAYVPAMVFHDVERLDALTMVRLLVPFADSEPAVIESAKPVADAVVSSFSRHAVAPRVAEAAGRIGLFQGLTAEQVLRVAGICQVETYKPGEKVLVEGQRDDRSFVILTGHANVSIGEAGRSVGTIGNGECLGEMSLLRSAPHSATVAAEDYMEVAVMQQEDLNRLIRQRPDIGVVLYRNLAVGIGQKLWRTDVQTAKSV